MKKIEAIIRHIKLDDVKAALSEVGIPGITVIEVKGAGKQRGYTENWHGSKRKIFLNPKLLLKIVVPDEQAPDVIRAIQESARTGDIGDGKIFISTVDEVIGIRTGVTGDEAL